MTRDHTMDRRRLYGEIEPYASERHCQTKTLGLAKAVTGRYQAAS
jgi:hypothetical protein